MPGSIDIRVEVNTASAAGSTDSVEQGLVTGDSGAFPLLYQDNRALFTTILAGGFGAYSDLNPWFGQPQLFNKGSPIAGHLPGAQATWTEGFVEAGVGGASQIGKTPFYAYGAITALTSWSLGQDIYTDASRSDTSLKKGYGGLLYVDPDSGASLNVSAGRQNVTLNDGFLVHFVRGSANIGPRGGTYIGPRNANDFSVVIDGKAGAWSIKAFYIDPNELESIKFNTAFEGVNLRYAWTPDLSVDGTYITIPTSQSSYIQPGGTRLPREGLETLAAHLRWVRPFGIEGVWFETEAAHQTNENFPMSAWSAYGLAGYRASMLPWTPSLSYRYAYASGDDPRTKTFERYDPLLATGLGNWLQGVDFGKITNNSNLAVHRLQFNVTPDPALNLTFDWHLLRAPELNNLGGNPALSFLKSEDIGQEFTLTARWAISRNWYLQSLASVAIPGSALVDIGADKPWTTLQMSLYWTF